MVFPLPKFIRRRFGADKYYYGVIKEILGFTPNNIELFKVALIHRSASIITEDTIPINNERLEFLGDAVLESIVSDYLFIEFPDRREGFLTQMRSKIVNRQSLNELCIKTGLSENIISNAGGGVIQKHIYGDALEAIIGAVYLDQGYDFTNRLVINILTQYLDLSAMTITETDFKSRLIEWCQKSKHTIRFETGYDSGSTNKNPVFRSAAIIDDMEIGYGIGASKKEAEQHASYAVSQILAEDDSSDTFLEWVDDKLDRQAEDGDGPEKSK